LYSNVAADAQNTDTKDATFLRGHQVTGEAGYVEFDTILPGWYIGPAPPLGTVPRTSHVHVKVFHEYKIATAQLFFPDALLDEVYANVEPAASSPRRRSALSQPVSWGSSASVSVTRSLRDLSSKSRSLLSDRQVRLELLWPHFQPHPVQERP
jgi:protocatechuate 3,4-dioxygenase beta subunit